MSLYFKERIEEQKEDSENDKIVFTYPWIIELPPPMNENGDMLVGNKFVTTFGAEFVTWCIRYLADKIKVRAKNIFFGDDRNGIWNGTCFISYNLFYDNDMRFLYHSSLRTKMSALQNEDAFETPDGYMTKILEAITKRNVRRMVIFVELHLSAKYFYRPFEKPFSRLSETICDEYPEDLKSDYRFAFSNKCDFSIKCPDGSISCRRIVVNISSKLLRKYFSESNAVELVVDHLIDVVEPIVRFLHSLCFRMPKFYDLNYADRLLKAVKFFGPEEIRVIRLSIHQSLCQKFVTEINDFDSILRWMAIACQHSLLQLQNMVISTIVNKYYFKWQQLFPVNARNLENAMFRHVFGPGGNAFEMFEAIDKIFMRSCLTNVILE